LLNVFHSQPHGFPWAASRPPAKHHNGGHGWRHLCHGGGYVFIAHPFKAAVAFTLFLGWAILIGGIFRCFLAFRMRHHRGAAWVLFSAAISILLGGLIISQWPATGFYILGLFLGVELIFAGVGWLGLGLASKNA
jgi:uncharacterized membrane protein HdeD (DUF308 family)